MAASIPYYRFREVLTVREADRDKYRSLADLRGRRVATLSGTIAYDLLLQAEREQGVVAVSYDDDVHPYSDLLVGRVDAVLLDNVLANRALGRNQGLFVEPAPVQTAHYVVITAPGNRELRDGSTRRCWRRCRTAGSSRSCASGTSGTTTSRVSTPSWPAGVDRACRRQQASSARASPASCRPRDGTCPRCCAPRSSRSSCRVSSMALAVACGMLLAIGRVYGNTHRRGSLLTAYVEVMRGTPVLLQLFVIYYGLSGVVRLPAFMAALLGLGLNYAAYESEIYRSALEAVPRGQLEAARILGFSERQTLRLIRGPQAFRLALAPMTNDFVALLKDSSLVSVITVVELTKQTQIFAANIGSWVIPGLLCAALYLAMSLPLAQLARRLEEQWRSATS